MRTTPPLISRDEFERRRDSIVRPREMWILWAALILPFALTVVLALAYSGSAALTILLVVTALGLASPFAAMLFLGMRQRSRMRRAGLLCAHCAAPLVTGTEREVMERTGRCAACGEAFLDDAVGLAPPPPAETAADVRLPSAGEMDERLRRAEYMANRQSGIVLLTITAGMGGALIALNIPSRLSIVAVIAGFAAPIAVLIPIAKRFHARMRELGVECPHCAKALYQPAPAIVRKSGCCPHCLQPVMAGSLRPSIAPRREPEPGPLEPMLERVGESAIIGLLLCAALAYPFAPRGEYDQVFRAALPRIALVVLPAAVLAARLLWPGWWHRSAPANRLGIPIAFGALATFALTVNGNWVNALVPPQRREVVQGRVLDTFPVSDSSRYVVSVQVAGRDRPLRMYVKPADHEALKPGATFRRELVRGGLGLYYHPR